MNHGGWRWNLLGSGQVQPVCGPQTVVPRGNLALVWRPAWPRMEGARPGPWKVESEERTRWQLEVEAGGTGLGGVPVLIARVPPATTEEGFGARSARAEEPPSARNLREQSPSRLPLWGPLQPEDGTVGSRARPA